MNSSELKPLRVAIVSGEESGDILGADLISSLHQVSGRQLELFGIGGPHLAAEGLQSLFDPHEIALMGFSAIISKLPRLLYLIQTTANSIVSAQPDVLIIVDSPDFTHRVARKVKQKLPNMPVVNYVCPSVWAWRQSRAREMRSYVDHVLAVLPFEPAAMQALGGPSTTYVGHRLVADAMVMKAVENQRVRDDQRFRESRHLLLLPGSRRGEIRRSLPVMKQVVQGLVERVVGLQVTLPTLAHLEAEVQEAVKDWPLVPKITIDHQGKMEAFGVADAALAASGTVTLETVLCGVPTVSFYKTDFIASAIMPYLYKAWSASLPNLIVDDVLVPESYNQQATPGRLMRQVEQLLKGGPVREAQVQGFKALRARMQTDEPAGMKSARIVLGLIEKA